MVWSNWEMTGTVWPRQLLSESKEECRPGD
jgi:hypothetical protein